MASRKSSFVLPQNPSEDEVAALLAIEKAVGDVECFNESVYPLVSGVLSAYLRAMPYPVYLRTRHWRNFRRMVLAAWGATCQECGATECELHIHHLTYETLGNEGPSDIRVLCADCHGAAHNLTPNGGGR